MNVFSWVAYVKRKNFFLHKNEDDFHVQNVLHLDIFPKAFKSSAFIKFHNCFT